MTTNWQDKAKAKTKGAGSSGPLVTINDEALATLMVTEYAIHNEPYMEMKKEECLAFLEIIKMELHTSN